MLPVLMNFRKSSLRTACLKILPCTPCACPGGPRWPRQEGALEEARLFRIPAVSRGPPAPALYPVIRLIPQGAIIAPTGNGSMAALATLSHCAAFPSTILCKATYYYSMGASSLRGLALHIPRLLGYHVRQGRPPRSPLAPSWPGSTAPCMTRGAIHGYRVRCFEGDAGPAARAARPAGGRLPAAGPDASVLHERLRRRRRRPRGHSRR